MGIRTDRFMFDGKNSYTDFNLLVCNIGKEEDDTTSAGSKFTKKTHYSHTLKKWIYYGYEYEEPLTFTFDVIKDPCKTSNKAFTPTEIQEITNWLMRTDGDKKFVVLNSDWVSIDYFGTCTNIDLRSVAGEIIGLTITLETNAPFGYSDLKEYKLPRGIEGGRRGLSAHTSSTEEGKIFVNLEIECTGDGTVYIQDEETGIEFIINNCVNGEIIKVDGETKIITSSVSSHKIYDDFNFQYLYVSREIGGSFILKGYFTGTLSYRDIYKVGV